MKEREKKKKDIPNEATLFAVGIGIVSSIIAFIYWALMIWLTVGEMLEPTYGHNTAYLIAALVYISPATYIVSCRYLVKHIFR